MVLFFSLFVWFTLGFQWVFVATTHKCSRVLKPLACQLNMNALESICGFHDFYSWLFSKPKRLWQTQNVCGQKKMPRSSRGLDGIKSCPEMDERFLWVCAKNDRPRFSLPQKNGAIWPRYVKCCFSPSLRRGLFWSS